MSKQMKVSCNLQQDFTSAEQAQARENIGAAASTDVTNKSEIKVYEGTSTVHKNLMTIYQDSQTGAMAGITFNNENSNVTMVKQPTTDDGGKVLAATVPGGQVNPCYEWKSVDTVLGASVANAGKVLTVNDNGHAVWQTPTATSGGNVGVYEFTVTKVLNGTDTKLWSGSDLTSADVSESFVNCTSETCPVHITLDDYGRLVTGLRTGYNSITCESHTYVSPNANFATELGMWGFDDLCQVVAGMNRTWYLANNTLLDQNGIRSNTDTLKNGTLTIKFDFVFEI
jgi:hypothetical protein